MLKEFKQFIARGNVVDLAVGVVVGGAFGKIVTSLVNDIMMPVIGIISGGIDFTDLILKGGEAEIKYGSFLQNIIDLSDDKSIVMINSKIESSDIGKNTVFDNVVLNYRKVLSNCRILIKS